MTDVEDTYQPKHLKQYDDSWGHCCFSGCTPMGCPGRCCVQEMGHRPNCPMNPFRQFDQEDHDYYVSQGSRKHLAKPVATFRYGGALPPLLRGRCGCGDVQRYPNGCGPSGCQNRPA
jgi:hypothetical protein